MAAMMALVLATLLMLQTSAVQKRASAKLRKPARYVATAYCTKGTTDAGVRTRPGIVAADPRLLPFGSLVRVDGLGGKSRTFVVMDSGSAVKGRHLDIFMPSCASAKRFGRRSVTARLVGSQPTNPSGR